MMENESTFKCEHPVLLLHPYAKHYFVKYGLFCYEGNIISEYSFISRSLRSRRYDDFYRKFVSSFFRLHKENPTASYTPDSLFDYFHFIGDDGVCYPLFIIVPCGKCRVCSYSKLNDISARCALETYTSRCAPLFVTLTYDNEHLPDGNNVSLDDIQKFLKLLRINLNRFFATSYVDEKGNTKYSDAKISLRYLYSSEYTPSNKRPHYHLLIWNVPYIPNGLSEYQKAFFAKRAIGYPAENYSSARPNRFDNILGLSHNCPISSNINCDLGRIYGYDTLKKLIWCSWKKGFIQCSVSKDAGKYVAKYIGKGSQVPSGRVPTFVRWSTRRGLGFSAFDQCFKDLLLKNPSLTQLTFLDPKVGSIQKVCIPKYYRTLLAPSLSVLSTPFRKDLEQFAYCYKIIKCFRSFGYDFEFEVCRSVYKEIIEKFELFDPLCACTTRPLDIETKSVINKYRKLYFIPDNSEFYHYISGVNMLFWHYYLILKSFDLESIHLSDVLNYKYVSQLARKDYAEKNPMPVSHYRQKADYYYSRVHHTELRCRM